MGSSLEIDGIIGDGGSTVEVTFSLERVGRYNDTVHSKRKEPNLEVEITSPTFYTLRIKGQAILRAGVPTRVGILSPKGPDGLPDPTRKVIIFLRAETLVVPP